MFPKIPRAICVGILAQPATGAAPSGVVIEFYWFEGSRIMPRASSRKPPLPCALPAQMRIQFATMAPGAHDGLPFSFPGEPLPRGIEVVLPVLHPVGHSHDDRAQTSEHRRHGADAAGNQQDDAARRVLRPV